MRLAENLCELKRRESRTNNNKIKYYSFFVREPKKRKIDATSYKTRVALQYFCDLHLQPVISKRLIYDNVACQKGKGTHFALRRLTYFLTSYQRKYGPSGYVLKCDIRKYFEEIDHPEVLENDINVWSEDNLRASIDVMLGLCRDFNRTLR